jgi:GTP cyclohydrolase II
MIKVVFAMRQDIAVNVHNPRESFEVLKVERRDGRTYLHMKNLHSGEEFSGFEIGLLKSGFVFYRKDNTYNPIFA